MNKHLIEVIEPFFPPFSRKNIQLFKTSALIKGQTADAFLTHSRILYGFSLVQVLSQNNIFTNVMPF